MGNKVVFHSCECETCWVYARGKRFRRLREYVFCFIIYFILNRFNTKSPDSFLNGMIAQKKKIRHKYPEIFVSFFVEIQLAVEKQCSFKIMRNSVQKITNWKKIISRRMFNCFL